MAFFLGMREREREREREILRHVRLEERELERFSEIFE